MMVPFSIYFNKLVRLSLGRVCSGVGIRTVEGQRLITQHVGCSSCGGGHICMAVWIWELCIQICNQLTLSEIESMV